MYHVHNRPRVYPGQRTHVIRSGPQSQLLGCKGLICMPWNRNGIRCQSASTPHQITCGLRSFWI